MIQKGQIKLIINIYKTIYNYYLFFFFSRSLVLFKCILVFKGLFLSIILRISSTSLGFEIFSCNDFFITSELIDVFVSDLFFLNLPPVISIVFWPILSRYCNIKSSHGFLWDFNSVISCVFFLIWLSYLTYLITFSSNSLDTFNFSASSSISFESYDELDSDEWLLFFRFFINILFFIIYILFF